MVEVIDHIGSNVSDHERAKAFCQKALAAIGIELVVQFTRHE